MSAAPDAIKNPIASTEAVRSRAYDEDATRAHAIETCNRKFAALMTSFRLDPVPQHMCGRPIQGMLKVRRDAAHGNV